MVNARRTCVAPGDDERTYVNAMLRAIILVRVAVLLPVLVATARRLAEPRESQFAPPSSEVEFRAYRLGVHPARRHAFASSAAG